MLTLLRKLEDTDADSLASLNPDGVRSHLAQGSSSCRLGTGRSALVHLIRVTGLKKNKTSVLLPAYVAEGVIRPFRLLGVDIHYYGLNSSLHPELEEIRRLLMLHHNIGMIVVVHFFGYEAPIEQVLRLVKDFSPATLVVEDCAHSLFSRYENGEAFGAKGDFSLYSLNKFLPVPDGAILVSNREGFDVSLPTEGLETLPLVALEAYVQHLRRNGELLRTRVFAEARQLLASSGLAYETYYDIINNDFEPRRQSTFSRQVESAVDVGNLITCRRRNTALLMKGLDSDVFEPLYSEQPSTIVPLGVPVWVRGFDRATVADLSLQRGCHLATLAEKWDFIPRDEEFRFKVERRFIKNHLLVPVSEFLTENDILTMVDTLNKLGKTAQ